MWGQRAAYIGPSLNLAPHRNGVATLALGFDEPFALKIENDAAPQYVRMALIPAGARHHLIGEGRMGFIYLDSLSDDFARFAAAMPDAAALLTLPDCVGGHGVCLDGLRAWMSATFGFQRDDSKEAWLNPLLNCLHDDLGGHLNARKAAALSGLSLWEFQRRFRASVGLPFRRYRLWLRMRFIAKAISEGRSLTQAAQEAGFASSAHLSTSFRAMFGLSPSRLVAAGVQITCLD
jgi:AraC-like DNA-binding protein